MWTGHQSILLSIRSGVRRFARYRLSLRKAETEEREEAETAEAESTVSCRPTVQSFTLGALNAKSFPILSVESLLTA